MVFKFGNLRGFWAGEMSHFQWKEMDSSIKISYSHAQHTVHARAKGTEQPCVSENEPLSLSRHCEHERWQIITEAGSHETHGLAEALKDWRTISSC